MMRPMKMAGAELMFGIGCLPYVGTLGAKRVSIVIGGSSMEKSGILDKVCDYLSEAQAKVDVIRGVEPDPSFDTVMRGARQMLSFNPDLIIGLGGGSAMDAAKAMWIYYEHPELTSIESILPPNPFPKLRNKARMCCIPSTSGTASEVSRSIVISDAQTGMKHGIGNMEMMPDIAICAPEVTRSMPKKITAETGMDALTHALEALVSRRANYLSDILARQAAIDIIHTLQMAYDDGDNMRAREIMLEASMTAGIAFTNVSLGIVHSMAHTLGSLFHIPHGQADAILLPYIIRYNGQDPRARVIYGEFAESLGEKSLEDVICRMNRSLHIPSCVSEVVRNRKEYEDNIEKMAKMALADGCTKTNPVLPDIETFKKLFKWVYEGGEIWN